MPVLLATSLLGYDPFHAGAVAVAAFLGHCYPVYIGFKGGKGVATALGVYLVLSPLAVLGAFLLFVGLVWKTRYISVGSISAAAAIPALIWLHHPLPALAVGHPDNRQHRHSAPPRQYSTPVPRH
ncbi:MAG: glycerol-3-phosphate acyltransferase [Syntrophotaleaceae bacterium]